MSDDLLIDPVVVLDGGRIVAVETSQRSLQDADVVDLPGSALSAVDGDPTTDITAMHRITAVYAHGNRIR